MSKLFAVMLGGRAPGCNLELHDVVFVAGETIEATYPKLVKKWFGHSKRLHIDAYVELDQIGAYKIELKKEPATDNKIKLFFINFGGYQSGYFGEIHEANFYIAESKTEALAKAKRELCISTSEQHCDDNLLINDHLNTNEHSVDDVILVDKIDHYFVHLQPVNTTAILTIQPGYFKLDKPEILEKAEVLK